MELLIIVFSINILFAEVFAQSSNENTDKTKIILVNPGVFYLKSLAYLTDHKIIDKKNMEYQAVFYTKNEISYDDAENFLKVYDISYIKLKKVELK